MTLSQTVDALPADEVCRRYQARWNDENRGAVAACNARVETEALPLAKHRSFMKAG